ncbi:TadE/TadG family type IV pilus assembly protein [Pseudaestuariivita atlantica]|uniref:Pilus assembly protein TadE n=1 Tax=Pseudaestuariivita atlantica TaxID=1317121 RepID=A0A0L1JLM4_9RHOB|nr:pilus assembly protein [Pseudaestuariivita atlantica]KNG92654.1 hypothetical protein ATO11_16705 [Pseudaestuariivita atlantica]
MTHFSFLARFRNDERGNMTVEAVILLPILIVMFIAMFVLFDYFRAHSVAGKTAYTVGDMISRETDYITPGYMDGAMNLVTFMNGTDAATAGLRVTVIGYDGPNDALTLEWSWTEGTGYAPLNEAQVNALRDQIPDMPSGQQIILVETKSVYDPIVDLGLSDAPIETFVATMPRFAPQVQWQG